MSRKADKGHWLSFSFLTAFICGNAVAQDQQFPAVFELGNLDGVNGFRIHDGIRRTSACPGSAAGDVNGDGIEDLVVAASFASPGGRAYAGSGYIVYGHRGSYSESAHLEEIASLRLDGGAVQDYANQISPAGDFNGDGLRDVIVGAYGADPDGLDMAGSSYVLFGTSNPLDGPITLDSIQLPQGFRIEGGALNRRAGSRVNHLGDVNGDGLDDLFVSTPEPDSSGVGGYVIFGRSSGLTSTLTLDSLTGEDGFQVQGVASSVAAAGDVNDDGVDDIIIGVRWADPNGVSDAGSAYVVYGKLDSFESPFSLPNLDQTLGYRIDGGMEDDYFGGSVSGAGDVNGDGIDDMVIGAFGADPGGISGAGSSYVIFGRRGLVGAPVPSNVLNGLNGFRMNGLSEESLGASVSGVGDVNNDGLADFILGAESAHAVDQFSGRSYVIFGQATPFGALLDLAGLDGVSGFRIEGRGYYDFAGSCVSSAGDLNGDGVNDIYVGSAHVYEPFGIGIGGDGYIIFGINSEQIFADGFN